MKLNRIFGGGRKPSPAVFLAVCVVLAATSAQAAPMAYKDGIMFMAMDTADETEVSANYALTSRDAVGYAFARQTSGEGVTRKTHHATYTRLAKRWNLPDAQANIWLLGNVAQVRGDGLSSAALAWEPGVQVDYETTRVYFSGNWHSQRALGGPSANAALLRHNQSQLSGGFSFYGAEYDEVQPWLIVRVQRETGWIRERSVTPMIRLIHKAFFLELGVKRDLDERSNRAQVNLMLTH